MGQANWRAVGNMS